MDSIVSVSQLADRLTPFLIPRLLRAIPAAGVGGGSTTIIDPGPGGGGSFTGGSGIDITGTVISADLGNGLNFDGSNRIRVRLATPSGLDFNGSGELVLSDSVAGFGINISGKIMAVSQSTAYTWTAQHAFNPGTAQPPFTLNANAQSQLVVGLRADQLNKSIVAGTGLTGGGILTADRTVNVNQAHAFVWTAQHAFNRTVAGPPFTLNANAQNQTVVGFRADQLNKTLVAGSGMTGGGIWTADRTLTLGTPSQLTVNSTDNVTATSHTHSILSSSNPGASRSLLASTTAGGLTLQSLDVVGAVNIGQSLFSANSSLRAIHHTHDYDHVHLVINPGPFWNLDEQFGVDIDDNLLVRGYIVGKHAIQLPGALFIAHYDGAQPFETNYSGNPTGHMGQVANASAPVIYRPGKFGKAVQTGRAATNLVTNPSFETNTTGWGALNTATLLRTTEESYNGEFSLRVITAANFDGTFHNITLAPSTTYTISGWFKTNNTANGMRLQLFNNTASTTVGQTDFSLGLEWERRSLTVTTPAGSTSYSVRFSNPSAYPAVGRWYIDSIQVEQRSFPTPYVDGSLPGHTWSGTAHASTSSRTAAWLSYPTQGSLRLHQGTIMAWVNINHQSSTALQYVFAHQDASGNNGIHLFYDGVTFGHWRARTVNNAGTSTSATVNANLVNGWHHVAMSWTSARLRIYINGELRTETANPVLPTVMQERFRVGANFTTFADNFFDGRIDELVVAGREVDGDEIRAIYESNAPVFAETSTWHWRSGRNRIYADAEGLWGMSANNGPMLGLYAGEDNNPSATKSWGGRDLSEGDFLLGNANRGAYMQWVNASAQVIIGREGTTTGALVLDGDAIRMVRDGVDRVTLTAGNNFDMRDANNVLRFRVDPSGNVTIRDTGGTSRVVLAADNTFELRNPSNQALFRVDTSGNLTIRDSSDVARVALAASGVLSLRNSAGNNVFTFDSATGAEFTLPLTLGSAGGIYQGTGSFAAGFEGTGLKIWRDGNVGRIAGYNSNVLQWGAGTDGKLTAGAGSVVLDANGIFITEADGLHSASPKNVLVLGGGGYIYGVPVGRLAIASSDRITLTPGVTPYTPTTANAWLFLDASGDVDIFSNTRVNLNARTRVNQIYSDIFDLPNNAATSLLPPAGTGIAIIMCSSNINSGRLNGQVAFRAAATSFCVPMFAGANFATTTGTLSGTTGTAGNVTVSMHTDGRLYIENRDGATRAFKILFIG